MPRVHVDIPLRWGDHDEYGHVNNVSYPRYLEEARVRVFSLGVGPERTGLETLFQGSDDVAHKMLLASQHIDFLGIMHYGEKPAVIEMWIGNVGGASFEVHAEVLDGRFDTRQVVARAISTLVVVDSEHLRPKRLSRHERETLHAWRDAPLALRGV